MCSQGFWNTSFVAAVHCASAGALSPMQPKTRLNSPCVAAWGRSSRDIRLQHWLLLTLNCAQIPTSAVVSIPRPQQLSREQGPARLTGLATLSAGTDGLMQR